MIKERTITALPLDGGLLCLDFVNTTQTRKKSPSHEYLPDYTAFLKWCLKVDLLAPHEVEKFKAIALRSAERAVEEHISVLEAREVLYSVFSALAAGNAVAARALQGFNRLVSESMEHVGFKKSDIGLAQTWFGDSQILFAPVWKIIKSAYDIITSPQIKYVKECPMCGWIFLDKSPAHSRRWCNPLECGSVDKATRYYHRKKAKGTEG